MDDAAVFTDVVDVVCADAVPVERSTPTTSTKQVTTPKNPILKKVNRRMRFSHSLGGRACSLVHKLSKKPTNQGSGQSPRCLGRRG